MNGKKYKNSKKKIKNIRIYFEIHTLPLCDSDDADELFIIIHSYYSHYSLYLSKYKIYNIRMTEQSDENNMTNTSKLK